MGWYIENEDALKYKVEISPTVLEGISKCFGVTKLKLLSGIAHKLEWQEITPITSFYRSNKAKVSRAIEYINTNADGEKIKNTLLAHIHETIRLLDSLAEQDLITKAYPVAVELKRTTKLSEKDDDKLLADLKPLDQYIEPYTFTRTETTTEKDIKAIKRLYKENPHLTPASLPKLGETKNYVYKGFRIKQGSEKAVAEFMLKRPYRVERDTSLRNQETQHEYYKAINIFAVEVGLTTDEKIKQQPHFMVSNRDGEQVIANGLTLTLSSFLEAILSILKDRYDKRLADARKVNTPVNIQKTYHGDYIAKPPIDMTEADIAQVAKNPESVNTLTKVYRNSQALDAEGGLLATVSDPTLFDMLPVEYQAPLKVVSLMNRTYRRGYVALSRYMVQNNGTAPAVLDTIEVAKCYGAYNEQIAKHGYLPTAYLNSLITELTLIKGQEVYYTYFDAELKKEMIGSIKIFDFDISTDGRVIKNLKYTQAYIDAFNDPKRPMLHLAIPKSLDYLKPFEQDIAYRIIQRFVGKRGERGQKQRIGKTVRGEHLKMSIPELYEGYIPAYDKRTRSRAKKRTLEALAEIQQKGDIIAKYEITNEGRKTFVLLYPSEYVRTAYKDKATNASLETLYKSEQKLRRDDLKKLVKLVRKDLRAKKNSTEYLRAVAEDIGLSSTLELGEYMIEPNRRKKVYPKEIDDELYNEIKEQIDYYES